MEEYRDAFIIIEDIEEVETLSNKKRKRDYENNKKAKNSYEEDYQLMMLFNNSFTPLVYKFEEQNLSFIRNVNEQNSRSSYDSEESELVGQYLEFADI